MTPFSVIYPGACPVARIAVDAARVLPETQVPDAPLSSRVAKLQELNQDVSYIFSDRESIRITIVALAYAVNWLEQLGASGAIDGVVEYDDIETSFKSHHRIMRYYDQDTPDPQVQRADLIGLIRGLIARIDWYRTGWVKAGLDLGCAVEEHAEDYELRLVIYRAAHKLPAVMFGVGFNTLQFIHYAILDSQSSATEAPAEEARCLGHLIQWAESRADRDLADDVMRRIIRISLLDESDNRFVRFSELGRAVMNGDCIDAYVEAMAGAVLQECRESITGIISVRCRAADTLPQDHEIQAIQDDVIAEVFQDAADLANRD